MSIRNTSQEYGSVAKFFHWLIFFLLTCMLIFGYFLDDVPELYKHFALNIHKLTGLLILTLMLCRLFWALINPKPLLPYSAAPWQRWAERVVHGLLYLTVIAMPFSGWIGSNAAGKPPHFGDINFTLPVPASKTLAHNAFQVHGILAITIIVLVSVHLLAALYHQFIKKDDLLRRMMPRR